MTLPERGKGCLLTLPQRACIDLTRKGVQIHVKLPAAWRNDESRSVISSSSRIRVILSWNDGSQAYSLSTCSNSAHECQQIRCKRLVRNKRHTSIAICLSYYNTEAKRIIWNGLMTTGTCIITYHTVPIYSAPSDTSTPYVSILLHQPNHTSIDDDMTLSSQRQSGMKRCTTIPTVGVCQAVEDE